MKRILTACSIAAMISACNTAKVGPMGGSGNGTSIVSSIGGDQKDIKELSDNFKDFKAKLTCDGNSWDAASVKLSAKSLDIVFKVKSSLEGKECQVELRGNLVDGKKAQWTSPDTSVGLLYVSTKEKVSGGSLKVNFYKTFIVTDATKTYRPLTVHASFTAKYLMDGADKAVLKTVNLSCKDHADVSAKLDNAIEFAKDVKDAKADIAFPQVEVGALAGCVFKALFDDRTELSTDAMDLAITSGTDAQSLDANFKNAVTLQDVTVDGTLNNQQLKDLLRAKDLIISNAHVGLANQTDGTMPVDVSVKAAKAGQCQLRAQGYDASGKASLASYDTVVSLQANAVVEKTVPTTVEESDNAGIVKFLVSAKCDGDSDWVVVNEIDQP